MSKRTITPEEENAIWRNMVAFLCRDGGHYLTDHGVKTTALYIQQEITHQRVLRDRLVAMLGEAVPHLQWIVKHSGDETVKHFMGQIYVLLREAKGEV